MTLDTGTAILRKDRCNKLCDFLLVLVLLVGAYFRLNGVKWDEIHYLHPDERFLAMVESGITPITCLGKSIPVHECPPELKEWISLKEYFDTANSTLNPNNRSFDFFVYGTLPIFIVRYVAEWLGKIGYGDIALVGRPLSALFDLATVYLMYVVVSRIYDKRVGLLATAFSSLAVLQIQLSHFFTVDIFANFFIWLALYFAARIATAKPEGVRGASLQEAGGKGQNYQLPVTNYQPLLPTLLFGAALGMAAASKISAAPVALMLPVAGIIYLYRVPLKERINQGIAAFALMALAAVISLAAFRIFQPYAFAGPGFFDLTPNERWLDGLNRLRDLLQPSVGYPPAVQWFDRSIWFSGQNLTLWGLGLPLGLTAWAGFLWVGWRIFKKGEWKQHLLIWGWVAFHFVWQSSGFNPTMRYQLSIYPGMAAFAAWAIIQIWDAAGSQWSVTSGQWAVISNLQSKIRNWIRPLALTIGALTLLGTFLWALAFSQIYNRQVTRIEASRWIFQNIPGPINVRIQTAEGIYQQPLPFPQGIVIRAEQPFTTSFVARADGVLGDISLTNVTRETTTGTGPLTLNLAFADQPDTTHPLAVAAATVDPGASGGDGLRPVFAFDSPIRLQEGQTYYLMLVPGAGSGQISLAGAAIAVESSWDDPIPYRVDGYDGFGGIYRGGLNFEMYWEDTADKRERFIDILNRADVIVITSSRQWASLTRLPGKYPITIAYYRNLLGCPADRTIEWCYNVAELGTFTENLGFELVKTFQSDPNLGPIRINDQFSEEAFTVYDHPKVFILVKSAGYDPDHVRAVLGAAPLASDQPLPAEETGETEKTEEPKTLLLPPDRLEGQQSGGTWSDLFNSDGFLNRFQVVTVLYWYLAVALLGVIAYPIVRVALPGLADRGYPLARTAGLLLLSYLVWLAGSFNIPFSRLTITIVALLIVLVGGGLAYLQRDALRREWREKRRYFATVEALSLALFLFLLFVRLGNPDLWHPWKGGEKPMDFAYFNAVLKSTTFPPYDPWFAGGYINYYYYGFVYVGALVKWLGVVPAIAYNLVLPTLFSILGLGAFSLGWNVVERPDRKSQITNPKSEIRNPKSLPYLVGLAASLGITLLGNLGIPRMIFQGYQKLAAPPEAVIGEAFFLTRWVWAIRGLFEVLKGETLRYSVGDWYWLPSRAIPAPGDVEPITEFPFFTFLYADLHAHLIALPLTVLALAWVVSVVLARGRWESKLAGGVGFLLGGLAIGALRPTNTWDYPTYLALGVLALVFAIGAHYRPREGSLLSLFPVWVLRGVYATVAVGILVGLSWLLYQPYTQWYALGYTETKIWSGTHTPVSAYFTHWGLFLFLILSWMLWETREWMANTPVSALRKLIPFRETIWGFLVVLLGLIGWLMVYLDVSIAWLVLPLAAWAGVLLLRPGMPDLKRLILFLVGTGFVLTLAVEIVVLSGDIGRMNTVFKFYLQVWVLFGISAAASLGWLMKIGRRGVSSPVGKRLRAGWGLGLAVLVFGAFMYPVLGGMAKIEDRMAEDAPHTLDGMAYMPYARYNDNGRDMHLDEDYRAIRWLQENVEGSPVIVEGNTVEYRWGGRYSIYTGLPAVLGWNWHQRQQRTGHDSDVWTRKTEIDDFYFTTNQDSIRRFLERHHVTYIIVGQLERAYYDGPGIEKFEQLNGEFWREVYRDGETAIYEVVDA